MDKNKLVCMDGRIDGILIKKMIGSTECDKNDPL